MRQTRKPILALLAAIVGVACGPHAASAQDATAPGGYQFFVTPYLWLASVHSTTKTPLARVPDVNSNVSTIDLLSHLDGVPVMGSVGSLWPLWLPRRRHSPTREHRHHDP